MAMKLGGVEIFGVLGGIGGYALLNRIDKAVRPKSRFVLAEIGITVLKIGLGLEAGDICYKAAKDVVAGIKNGTEKALKRMEKEDGDSGDGIHLHVVKNTAEDHVNINDFGKWLKEREEKGIFEDGNE